MILAVWRELPDVHPAAAGRLGNAVFAGKLVRQQAEAVGNPLAVDAEGARVAAGSEHAVPVKTLPIIGVVAQQANLALVLDGRNVPFVRADDLTGAPLEFAERGHRRIDADAFGGHDDGVQARFANEGVDGVGRVAPAGVDQAAVDGELGAVLAGIGFFQHGRQQIPQGGHERAFLACAWIDVPIGRRRVAGREHLAGLVRICPVVD